MQSISYFHHSTTGGPLGVVFLILAAVGFILLLLSIGLEQKSTAFSGFVVDSKLAKRSFTVLASGAIVMILGFIGFAVVSLVSIKTQQGELQTWVNENYSLNLSESRAADLYRDAFGRHSVHDGIHVKQDGKTVRIMLKQVEGSKYKLLVTSK